MSGQGSGETNWAGSADTQFRVYICPSHVLPFPNKNSDPLEYCAHGSPVYSAQTLDASKGFQVSIRLQPGRAVRGCQGRSAVARELKNSLKAVAKDRLAESHRVKTPQSRSRNAVKVSTNQGLTGRAISIRAEHPEEKKLLARVLPAGE